MNLDFLLKFGVMVHEFLWFIACPTHLIWHDLTKLINIWFCTALHIDIGVYDSYLQLLLPSHQDWLDGEAGYFTTEIMQIGMGNRIDFSASEGFKEQSSCLCQYMGHIGPHTHIHASYIYIIHMYTHTHIYIYMYILCACEAIILWFGFVILFVWNRLAPTPTGESHHFSAGMARFHHWATSHVWTHQANKD